MVKDLFASVTQALCNHLEHKPYAQRRFDILKGFEMVETKCLNCHKILAVEIKKIGIGVRCKQKYSWYKRARFQLALLMLICEHAYQGKKK